jgi:hypothetical protein
MAIQDDYRYWNQNGELVDSAKLMIVDQTDYNTLEIFFDDNVQE